MRLSMLAMLGFLAFSHAGSYKGITDAWSFNLDTFDQTAWMSTLGDDVPLTSLSIPGTHHSMTDNIEDDSMQTQNMPLLKQLHGGIRYIDITCRYTDDSMMVYNGRVNTGYSLEDVLTTLFDFLDAQPSEAIILRIQKGGIPSPSTAFLDSMEKHFVPGSKIGDRAVQKIYSSNTDGIAIPTLGDARGKVLVLQDFNTSPPGRYGIPWDLGAVSGYNYRPDSSNLLLTLKWAIVKTRISQSRANDYDKLRITYATAGIVKNGFGYGMNWLLGRYIMFEEGDCFGIIVMDFPGCDVVQQILLLNAQYRVARLPDVPSDQSATTAVEDVHTD
ncbi:1-phosphatidylinositol phosphodiesterase [Ceratocystis lukuohia]|uniref:1-phosphatidylinositol phosphodiesterase n=1 Tax=Ceratocystis lukuohia TaxID=2019550 RepID=A0ABR4M8N6_9PEZI